MICSFVAVALLAVALGVGSPAARGLKPGFHGKTRPSATENAIRTRCAADLIERADDNRAGDRASAGGAFGFGAAGIESTPGELTIVGAFSDVGSVPQSRIARFRIAG